MLKFKGPFEAPLPHTQKRDKFGGYDINLPTVDDYDEVLSPMYADTVLQILRGQGIYWGWEVSHDYDNKVPSLARTNKAIVIDTQSEESKKKRKQAARELRKQAEFDSIIQRGLRAKYNSLDEVNRRGVQLTAQARKISIENATKIYLATLDSMNGDL